MESSEPKKQDIDQLLAFLPLLYAPGFKAIEKWGGGTQDKDGVYTAPWPEYNKAVTAFFAAAANPCWCDYEYNPDQAGQMLKNHKGIAIAPLQEIKTMLTFCVRGERFCNGHWAAMIEDGHIQ